MKSFLIDHYTKGGALRLGECPEPELRDNDVMVEIHCAGVNLLDNKIRDGEFKLILPYRLPLVLGNDVAGVDCSAFVSAAWGLGIHYTTAAIPAIAKPVTNPWDLRPGDALNKPGSHVMLFLRFTPDRKAEVMESSTGGCNGKVCRNVYPLAALLARGYQPVRFKALADDAMVVAQSTYEAEKEVPTGREIKKTAGRELRKKGKR